MCRTRAAVSALVLALVACTDPVATSREVAPLLAKGDGATLYKLHFVTGINVAGDGEIQSGWFPPAGIALNTRTPWRSLGVAGATIDLVNFTHGNWAAGTCATFTSSFQIVNTTWDISGTNPIRSFAGAWTGTLSTNQAGSGTSVAFDGNRVGGPGGIHNVVTNGNQAIETKGPNNDWFQLEIRNSAMAFGSASSPDGNARG